MHKKDNLTFSLRDICHNAGTIFKPEAVKAENQLGVQSTLQNKEIRQHVLKVIEKEIHTS